MMQHADVEHLHRMQGLIQTYENEIHSLETLLELTQQLEKTLNTLTSMPEEWKEAFRTEWWELEFTSSLMMDNEQDNLTAEDEEAVSIALINMKEMLNKFLENLKQ